MDRTQNIVLCTLSTLRPSLSYNSIFTDKHGKSNETVEYKSAFSILFPRRSEISKFDKTSYTENLSRSLLSRLKEIRKLRGIVNNRLAKSFFHIRPINPRVNLNAETKTVPRDNLSVDFLWAEISIQLISFIVRQHGYPFPEFHRKSDLKGTSVSRIRTNQNAN